MSMSELDAPAATCLECKRPIVDPENAWREVVGFTHHRTQGGDNHVAQRKLTGRLMCKGCMVLLQDGVSAQQMTL
mgnify:CR=1 FL=1